MYKILGADQKEYGPASPDQIRQWIADGRVTGQTRAQAEGSREWKSLSEFSEFGAALAAKAAAAGLPPVVGPVTTPPPISSPSNPPPSSGLAIASLVLGGLSFFGCSIFTGIPAIITGHIAYSRARRTSQPSGTRGLAMAGLLMGYVSLAMLPILAGLLLPALAKAKEKAQQINCVNNLKQIGLAAHQWANDHDGKFPPNFIAMSNELGTPKILVCPSDRSKTRALNWSAVGPGNFSYIYLEPGTDANAAAQKVVFQCPIHGNVGLGDGSVLQGGPRGGGMRR